MSLDRLFFHQHFSIFVLIGALLVSTLANTFYNQSARNDLQQQLRDHYGQALADTGAEQSVVAMLSGDLLSLQTLLEDIAANPQVVGATLHDVDNQLLVQGGLRPNQYPNNKHLRSSYSAPVSLDNALAGSLTVILAPPMATSAFSYSPYILVTLLIATLASGLLIWQQRVLKRRFKGKPEEKKPTSVPIITPTKNALEDSSKSPSSSFSTPHPTLQPTSSTTSQELPTDIPQFQANKEHVQLQINCLGLTKLNQTLARDRYKSLVFTLESRIDRALKLYGGSLVAVEGDTFTLNFTAEHQDSASFNALCACFLLIDIYRDEKDLKPLLRAHLEAVDNDQLLNRIEHQQNIDWQDWAIQVHAELISPELKSRVKFNNTQASSVADPFKRLLLQQREHLEQLDL